MVIRMRHTRAHTKNRRSHHALKTQNLVKCTNCEAFKLRHRVCMKCGFYRGAQVIDIVARVEKRQAKKTLVAKDA